MKVSAAKLDEALEALLLGVELEAAGAEAAAAPSPEDEGKAPEETETAASPPPPREALTELQVNAVRLGEEGSQKLAAALAKCPTLTALAVTANKMNNNDCINIARAAENHPALTCLDFRSNQIWQAGAVQLRNLLQSPTSLLTTLKLDSNRLAPVGAAFLADGLAVNTRLTWLGLGFNEVQDEGLEHLSAALAKNSTLRTLRLESNDIKAAGVSHLARNALKVGTTPSEGSQSQSKCGLTALDLTANEFGDEAAEALLAALQENRSLVKLDIFACDVEPALEKQIRALVDRNAEAAEAASS